MSRFGQERIAFLTPSIPRHPGGGARVYFEHANRLAERGYRVTVVHPLRLGSGRLLPTERLLHRLRDLRAGSPGRRPAWMRLDPRVEVRIIDRLDECTALPEADLRIGTYWRTNEILGARQDDGVPVLQLIQAYEVWAGPTARVDATWRLPFPIAVVSKSLIETGLRLGIPRSALHYVPNGIDHRTYRVTRPIERRRPCVAILAQEAPVKGLADSVEVLRAIHQARPDVQLLAFGSFARPEGLPVEIAYHRKPVGRRLVEQVYNRASVFLCASRSEGFGFPSIEAMACGAALVSTANGGVDDFAQDGVNAVVRPVGDCRALADAVLCLLDDEQQRLRLVTSALDSVARFTWEASAEHFHRAVRAALDGDGR